MTMNYEQWKRMLSAVDKEEDLSKDNVIEKIKEELKKYPEEYKKWEKVGFDVNHLFEVASGKLTLLHLAAYEAIFFDDPGDVANALLGVEGINVDAKDGKGNILLHAAAGEGHIDVVNALIKNEADVNALGQRGWTSLHLAAEKGHIDVVKALVENKANPLLKNKYGKTPRDLAKDDSIKNLLKEAEEKQLKQQALNKSISAGGATVLLGTAAAVALFATGTVAVELIPILIAVVAVTVAALAVGGVTYMVLKPSTKIDEVKKEQGITRDERKA